MDVSPQPEESTARDSRLPVALVHAEEDARPVHAFRQAFDEALGDARDRFVLRPGTPDDTSKANAGPSSDDFGSGALADTGALVLFLSRRLMVAESMIRSVLPALMRQMSAARPVPLAVFTVTLDDSLLRDLGLDKLETVFRALPVPGRRPLESLQATDWMETAVALVRELEELQASSVRRRTPARQVKSSPAAQRLPAAAPMVSPPPPARPLPTGQQRLLLAFYAVLSQPSQFALLESLDPARLADEWQRLAESTDAADDDAAAVLAALGERHHGQGPHPLWLAWNQVVHAARLAT